MPLPQDVVNPAVSSRERLSRGNFACTLQSMLGPRAVGSPDRPVLGGATARRLPLVAAGTADGTDGPQRPLSHGTWRGADGRINGRQTVGQTEGAGSPARSSRPSIGRVQLVEKVSYPPATFEDVDHSLEGGLDVRRGTAI